TFQYVFLIRYKYSQLFNVSINIDSSLLFNGLTGGRTFPTDSLVRFIAAFTTATLFPSLYFALKSSNGFISCHNLNVASLSSRLSASNISFDFSGAIFARPDVNPSAPLWKKNGAHDSARPHTQTISQSF